VAFLDDGRAYAQKLDARASQYYAENQDELAKISRCLNSSAFQSQTGKTIQIFSETMSQGHY
jgi:hypothetical protein